MNKNEILAIVANKAVRYIGSKEKALQFTGIFTTEAIKNPKLNKCSPESIITSLMSCIYFNLLPNTPQGLAYLIPYGNNLTFQVGYKGLIELASRSGMIKTINAELVFDEDIFDIELGTERKITHKPDMSINRTDTSRVRLVYATAKLSNGDSEFIVLNSQEIQKITDFIQRKNFGKANNVWIEWGEMMMKKTAIKRLLKYLPQSNEDIRMAIAMDNASEGKSTVKYNQDTDNFDIEEQAGLEAPVKKVVDISNLKSGSLKIQNNQLQDATNPELDNIIEVKLGVANE